MKIDCQSITSCWGKQMILSKDDLKEYLEADKAALGITYKYPKPFRDEIWRFQIVLRKAEYAENCSKGLLGKIRKIVRRYIYHKKSVQLGFTIPLNVFDKGLSIAHYGTIVVNSHAKVGKYCRIQESVTIGATDGSLDAPSLGNYCFLGSGARVIGDIKIADNVAIGANAVVVKDIDTPKSTWAGIPAKQVSSKGADNNLIVKYGEKV